MPASGYRDAYLESEILSADSIELVRILYRAALDWVRSARRLLAAGDIKGRSTVITKSIAVLSELQLSLDRSTEPQLAANLVELYDYIQRLLSDANIRQDDAPLAEAEQLLATLLDGWNTAYALGSKGASRATPAQASEHQEPTVSCTF